VITLRGYQTDGIRQIREAFAAGFKAPLYVAPTGSGKTRLFSAIAESSEKRGKRVLILVHRIELVDQVVAALEECGVKPDVIAAGYSRRAGGDPRNSFRAVNNAVSVASVQTLVGRLDNYAPPTLIIIDEAHHATAGSYTTIMRHCHEARMLGVTATPIRLDGRGLAAHFDKLILGPSAAQLTAEGYLAPARIFAPPTVDTSGLHIRAGEFKAEEANALMDTPAIIGSALAHYRQHGNEEQALVFCTSVQHAHNVAAQFRNDGIAAVALDGGTDKDIRRMTMQDYRDGKIRVLTNCELFGEGVDLPGVHVGIMLRPTASLTLHLQQCGRILRPAPGKTHAIILDHVGNTERHGLPTDERDWVLTSDVIRKKKKDAPGIRICLKCWAASAARATVCSECGVAFEVKPRAEIEEKAGELVELTPEQIAKKRERREQGKSRSLEELIAFGRSKKYANPEAWARHVWNGRMAKKSREMV
jgi:DNA repair protein RadD